MLNVYTAGPPCLKKESAESGLVDSPVWIDMVHPTADEDILHGIGRKSDLSSKSRESLLSIGRLSRS